jgi:hypothetical protein
VLTDGQNEQQIGEGQCEYNQEPSANVHDILQKQNEQSGGLHCETKTEQSTDMGDMWSMVTCTLYTSINFTY